MMPALRHVEVEPMKTESPIIDPHEKYEEMGKVLQVAFDVLELKVGDIIFFDSYACRATPEINGKKHYFVNVRDGGLIAVERNVEKEPM